MIAVKAKPAAHNNEEKKMISNNAQLASSFTCHLEFGKLKFKKFWLYELKHRRRKSICKQIFNKSRAKKKT